MAHWRSGLFFLVLFPKRRAFGAVQRAIDAKARDALEIDGILSEHNASVSKKSKRRARIAALEVIDAGDMLDTLSVPSEKIELPKLTSFLYEQYQPKYYWFESVELVYKLSVTGMVVFFEAWHVTASQDILRSMHFLSLTLLMLLQPYAASSSNKSKYLHVPSFF